MNEANDSDSGSTTHSGSKSHHGGTPQGRFKPGTKRSSRSRFRNLARSSVDSVSPPRRTAKRTQRRALTDSRVSSSSARSDKAAKGGKRPKKLRTEALIRSDDVSKSAKLEVESESNENAADELHIAAKDIFGDADDISDDDAKQPVGGSLSQDNRSPDVELTSEAACRPSEDVQPQELPETRIDVVIPRIVADLGREITFAKLPNFLSVDTRPFDPKCYEDEIDEKENINEDGRKGIKLKVSNTIRYREVKNEKGEIVRETNTRLVRWSDGSLSLHLGSEIIDVYKQPVLGDHNHLFIRQGSGLQGQSIFRNKLTFRPHSTESMTHKKIIMSLADRSLKVNGIKILTEVGRDPNTDRRLLLKKEEEKLRKAVRNQHRTQPKKKKAVESRGDDVSDDDNAISLSAIKNRYKPGGLRAGGSSRKTIYSSNDDDDEESDFEGRRSRKKGNKAKAVKALCDSDSDKSTDQDKDTGRVDGKSNDSSSEDADSVSASSGSRTATTASASDSDKD